MTSLISSTMIGSISCWLCSSVNLSRPWVKMSKIVASCLVQRYLKCSIIFFLMWHGSMISSPCTHIFSKSFFFLLMLAMRWKYLVFLSPSFRIWNLDSYFQYLSFLANHSHNWDCKISILNHSHSYNIIIVCASISNLSNFLGMTWPYSQYH